MRTIAYLILACLAAIAEGHAQQAGLPITPADYKKWGDLSPGTLSPDGKWASYMMRYENGTDTLFVQETDGPKKHIFAGATACRFDPSGHSAAIAGAGDTLHWVGLQSGKILKLPAGRADFSPDGKKLIVMQKRNGVQGLTVCHQGGSEESWIPDVREYALSGNNLALSSAGRLLLLRLDRPDEKSTVIAQGPFSYYSHLAWSSSRKQLAFFERLEKDFPTALHYYDPQTGTVKQIGADQLSAALGAYHFSSQKLVFSEDGAKIYFTAVPSGTPEPEKRVEIWETGSRHEYPQEEFLKDPAARLQLSIWDTASGSVRLAGNQEFQDPKVLPGDRHVITRKPLPNTDPVLEVGYADYYISEIGSDAAPRFLWRASVEDEAVKASPDGRWLAYFDGKDYRVTDVTALATSSITAGRHGWESHEADYPGSRPAYGSPGFTADSRHLILYGEYDIWLATLQGKKLQRITDGRKVRTRYRIDRQSHVLEPPNHVKWTVWDFDLEKGLVLTAFNADKTLGYSRYSAGKGLTEIAMGKGRLSDISRTARDDAFLFTRQAAAMPPSLVWSNDRKKEKVLYQSNSHYLKYQWPKFELVSYPNKAKDTLQGILIYPSDYQPSKKYPMVVYIYERLSQGLHEYSAPKASSPIGFLPASYFLDGYFVLLPDLKFRTGEPGASALDCIEVAVGSVVRKGIVNEKRLGIIGHSFGGYLASYVAANSSLFSAAVSGAGVSDMTSSYLTMNFARSRSNNWRFESQQYRMGSTPFDNLEGYLKNSPITNAARITAPLLLWAGKSDTSVDFRQGVEMHLALRRLGKHSVLLLYPDQGHILTDPEVQEDLTERIKNWFDAYLKPL